MKYSLLLCSLLLISCGSPLDEGYWKEHNVEADLSDNNEARNFTVNFESLHSSVDISFSGQTFRRLVDQKVSLSVTINHPSNVNVTDFRIRNDACPSPTSMYIGTGTNQQSTFSRNEVPLSNVSADLNRNLENQYIYLRGTIISGTPDGVTTIDIACSDIRL